jgi:putative transposase
MLSRRYETDLTDAAWELVKPLLPMARHGGRPRTTDVRAVVDAIFYLLRTGCQWRLLPHQFPPWGTVYHYFRSWENSGSSGQPAQPQDLADREVHRRMTVPEAFREAQDHFGVSDLTNCNEAEFMQ